MVHKISLGGLDFLPPSMTASLQRTYKHQYREKVRHWLIVASSFNPKSCSQMNGMKVPFSS